MSKSATSTRAETLLGYLAQMDVEDEDAYRAGTGPRPEPRPEGLTDREPAFLTDYVIGRFLRRRPPPEDGPQFVACSPDHELWLVRWPSRAVRWQSRPVLEAQGFTVPDAPIVGEMEAP